MRRFRFGRITFRAAITTAAADHEHHAITDRSTCQSVASNERPSNSIVRSEHTSKRKVRPSVIWVTAFDPKGNLLRTETGFFISADGRFVSTAHAIEGAVNAVAKTADGGIYNVSGVLAASKRSDISVLQAEVKPRKLLRFLDLNKAGELTPGAKVAVVGSALAGSEGTAREMKITAQTSDRLEIADATPVSSVGSPPR